MLVGASLVDADGLSVEANLVHNLGRIVGLFLAHELDEAVALVRLRNAVLGQMDILDAAGLEHELPHETVGYALIEIADVHGRFLVLLPESNARQILLRGT